MLNLKYRKHIVKHSDLRDVDSMFTGRLMFLFRNLLRVVYWDSHYQ